MRNAKSLKKKITYYLKNYMKLLHGTYLRIAAVASIMMLAMPFVTLAQTKIQKHEPVKVYFRQGSSTLDPRHINNAAQLEELSKLLESYVVDSIKAVGHVHILSSASPEGSINTNQRLVEGRAKAIANWVSKRFNIEVGYKVEEMGIDWATDTYDTGLHLNVFGAEKAAAWFGRILAEECGVPDRRGDGEIAAQWAKKCETYHTRKETLLTQESQ